MVDFSHHKSHNPTGISCLAYFAIQGMLIMINILRKVANNENHRKWMYLITVLNVGGHVSQSLKCDIDASTYTKYHWIVK